MSLTDCAIKVQVTQAVCMVTITKEILACLTIQRRNGGTNICAHSNVAEGCA